MIQETTQRTSIGHAKALGLLLAVLMSLMLVARPAHADTTFTVNFANDNEDTNVGDGRCDVLSPQGDQCTLRAAIQQANATPGADTIAFDLPDNVFVPGDEVKSIIPGSPLPTITESVTIDGYTQDGATENTETRPGKTNANLLVELDGSDGGSDGLVIRASNVVVRGLVINRFPGSAINISNLPGTATGHRIEGNFLGTDPSGTEDRSSGANGVSITGDGANVVGGTSPEARNLLSGHVGAGVVLVRTADNRVEGNLIGIDKTGAADLGSGTAGVVIATASSGNTVGGANPGAANTIAFNGKGVFTTGDSGAKNTILGNSVFSNDALGIDIGAGGRTNNDPGDTDFGPNGLQNFPVSTSATASASKTVVGGNLDSNPNETFKLQFFSNPANTNEGKTFLGETEVTTSVDGLASFTFESPRATAAGEVITATATDEDGNTSEFSDPVTVAPNADPTATNDSRNAKKGKTLNVPAPGILANDSDPDRDPLTAQLVSGPARTVELDPDGSFAYTPRAKKGTDSFVYRVSDGKGGTDEARVTITISKKK